MNCSSCKFCNPISDDGGECRRHAPALMPFNGQIVWNFPGVNLDRCWCGEFSQKET